MEGIEPWLYHSSTSKTMKGMKQMILLWCCLLAIGCERNSMDLRYELSMDKPKGGTVVDDSIMQWMADVTRQHFGWTLLGTYDDLKSLRPDSVAICRYYAKGIDHAVAEYWKDLGDLKDQKGLHPIYIDTLSFHRLYENDNVFTYRVTEVNSMGDTHPSRYETYVSFCKSTGKRITFGQLFPPACRRYIVQRVFDEVDSFKLAVSPETSLVSTYVDIDKLDFDRVDANGYPLLTALSATSEFRFHNPAFTADGLLFYFYTDELGIYLEGPYTVVLPYDELPEERSL